MQQRRRSYLLPEVGAAPRDGPKLGGVEPVRGAREAEVELGKLCRGGRVRRERRHDVLRPAVELREVEHPEGGAGSEQRPEIRAAGEARGPLVPAHELDAAEAALPVRGESVERGWVAAVDGERGHGREAVREARGDEGVLLGDLLRVGARVDS